MLNVRQGHRSFSAYNALDLRNSPLILVSCGSKGGSRGCVCCPGFFSRTPTICGAIIILACLPSASSSRSRSISSRRSSYRSLSRIPPCPPLTILSRYSFPGILSHRINDTALRSPWLRPRRRRRGETRVSLRGIAIGSCRLS